MQFSKSFLLDIDGSVQEKEVCIGIVTQIDLLTYITRHMKEHKEVKEDDEEEETTDD